MLAAPGAPGVAEEVGICGVGLGDLRRQVGDGLAAVANGGELLLGPVAAADGVTARGVGLIAGVLVAEPADLVGGEFLQGVLRPWPAGVYVRQAQRADIAAGYFFGGAFHVSSGQKVVSPGAWRRRQWRYCWRLASGAH